jgi:hypothetical protein
LLIVVSFGIEAIAAPPGSAIKALGGGPAADREGASVRTQRRAGQGRFGKKTFIPASPAVGDASIDHRDLGWRGAMGPRVPRRS